MQRALYFIGIAVIVFLFVSVAGGQSNEQRPAAANPVLWSSVDVQSQDLFHGPGGQEMLPDLTKIEFIRSESGGSSKKYRIKDGSGRIWVAKIDKESQPETVAVRLLAALGYKTEINYLAPKITIPGKGTFENVRLEARPEDIDRQERWKWSDNPFNGTNELHGLKIMMALMNNWDLKDGNTIILQHGDELHYVISDLGATFGKLGSNNLPIFWRVGRSINRPEDYSRSDFIKGSENGEIVFAFKGKSKGLFEGITLAHGRWLANLLAQLSDEQIRDAFRAANYSDADIKLLSGEVKDRIAELDRTTQAGRPD